MKFISNSEQIWDLISNEKDLQSLGIDEHELIDFMYSDQLQLEKLLLKKDAEILNQCLVEDTQGKIICVQDPQIFLQRPTVSGWSDSDSNDRNASPERASMSIEDATFSPSKSNKDRDEETYNNNLAVQQRSSMSEISANEKE